MAKKKTKKIKSFEISNKILVAFVLLATAVSLVGLFTIEKETKLTFHDSGVRMLTGLTGTNETEGNVTATIESYTYINFSEKTGNFGTGYIEGGYDHCNFSVALGGESNDDGSCASETFNFPPTGLSASTTLTVENLGNEDVMLNLSTNQDALGLLGSSSGKSTYLFRIFDKDEPGSCSNNTGHQVGFIAPGGTNYSTWTDVGGMSNWNQIICPWFNSSTGNNEINIAFNIVIPETTPKSEKALVITAYGRTCDGLDDGGVSLVNCTNHADGYW